MYDPRIGQWLEEDPEGFAAGDPNLRRYVRNSPTNATDPTGLAEVPTVPDGDMPPLTISRALNQIARKLAFPDPYWEEVEQLQWDYANAVTMQGIGPITDAQAQRLMRNIDRIKKYASGQGFANYVPYYQSLLKPYEDAKAAEQLAKLVAGGQVCALAAQAALAAGTRRVTAVLRARGAEATPTEQALQQMESQARDPKLSTPFPSVTFLGGTNLTASEKGDSPQTLNSADASTPIVYQLGSTLKVKATFALSDAASVASAGKLDFTGLLLDPSGTSSSPGLPIIEMKNVEKSGNGYSFEAEASGPFSTVNAYAPLRIVWWASPSGADPLKESTYVGETDKKVYVTYGKPEQAPGSGNVNQDLLETFVAYGCRGASGESDRDKVIAGIWSNFAGKSASRASDGKSLYYYGSPLLPNAASQANPNANPNGPGTAAQLVRGRTGQCGAWADLFLATLYAQGLVKDGKLVGTNDAVKVVEIAPVETLNGAWMLIKPGWSGQDGKPTGGTNLFHGLIADQSTWFSKDKGWTFNWSGRPQVNYEPAKENVGQNQPFPPGMFPNHFVLRIGSTYYDPSYGGAPYTGGEDAFLKEFQKRAVYGFATLRPGGTPMAPLITMRVTAYGGGAPLSLKVISEK